MDRSQQQQQTTTPADPTHPLRWPWALNSPPDASSDRGPWHGALLRCWSGTSQVMWQPPLDHHYVVLHLGGPKRVTRKGDGQPISVVVDAPALTLVPAGSAYVWRTEGPIAFAHLYLTSQQLEQVIVSDFDAEGRDATLVDGVGCHDLLIEPLLLRMLAELECGQDAYPLMLDCLLDHVMAGLVRKHASKALRWPSRPLALAPYRLRRVLDFIDASLGDDIALTDLAAAAGSSQAHFSRAFQIAVGSSPYHYVLQRRIDYARVLLLTSDDSLQHVGTRCGFRSQQQFGLMFKRLVGVGPKRFRMNSTWPRR